MTSEDTWAAVGKVGNVSTGEGSLMDLLDGDRGEWTLCAEGGTGAKGAHGPLSSAKGG